MPRFVVLEHDWPQRHFDFLLEADGVLRAWRLLAEPIAGEEITAEPNFDHRMLYLEYEGPLSGDRGMVRRWDRGEFEWIQSDVNQIVVELRGERLSGRAVWTRSRAAWVFAPTHGGGGVCSGSALR
jgi:hypothetical protein